MGPIYDVNRAPLAPVLGRRQGVVQGYPDYVPGRDVERTLPPGDEAADLEHRLSDFEPVPVEDLRPYDERDVAELVLQRDEDGVRSGGAASG